MKTNLFQETSVKCLQVNAINSCLLFVQMMHFFASGVDVGLIFIFKNLLLPMLRFFKINAKT